ncbi:aldo/keto reductase [Candidatus Latescibacterota bacterium]
MKRRNFFEASMAATAGISLAGCSIFRPTHTIQRKVTDFSLEVTKKKPSGSMPMTDLGKTGIRISKFSFGSHMSQDLLKYEKERERMIREAFDLGITTFDIYEKNWDIFQYEPMGRYLKPIINDVVLSIFNIPFDGRSFEKEFERAQRLLGRECIDMVRTNAFSPEDDRWSYWEILFRLKEKGYIRAVGIPIHVKGNTEKVLELYKTYPMDFVIFPYNFYHNIIYSGERGVNWDPLIPELRKRGIGIVVMKPLASDHLVKGFINLAKKVDPEVSWPTAAHKYVINTLNPDTVLNGMYTLDHVYENAATYYHPEMTLEEKQLLDLMKRYNIKTIAQTLLPKHYAFLNEWVGA